MPYEILDDIEETGPSSAAKASLGVESIPGIAFRNLASGVVKGAGDIQNLFRPPELDLAYEGANPVPKLVHAPKKPESDKSGLQESAEYIAPEGYFEPKGEGERFAQNVIRDATLLFSPIKSGSLGQIIPKVAANLGKAISRSALGNAAKWATETITGSPLLGEGVKIGTLALAGTYGGRRQLENIKNTSYDQAFSNLPQNAKIDIAPTVSKIDQIFSKFKSDHPNSKFISERLSALKELVPGVTKPSATESKILNEFGKPIALHAAKSASSGVPVKELIDIKQGWNAYLRDSPLNKDARAALGKGVKSLNDAIGKYGKSNPSFYKPYTIGEELTGALQGSNKIQQLLDSSPLVQKTIKNPLAKYILGSGLVKGALSIGGTKLAAGVGGALALRESARAFRLLSKSPEARKYYKNVLRATLNNDSKLLLHNLRGLNHAADKFMTEDRSSNVGRYEILD